MRYSTLTTPIGELLLVADPDGALTAVHLPGRHGSTAGMRARRRAARARPAPAHGVLRRRAHRRSTSRCAPRARRSSCACGSGSPRIPYGETASYGEIARELGQPTASRAVGAANGRNPIAIVVPCHRVIGANGSLTGYAGGLDQKRALLDLEAGRAALV